MKIKSFKKAFKLIVVLLTILIIYCVYGNSSITITKHNIQSEKLPSSFNSFIIAQVSDLHNAAFGKDNERLIKKLESTNPDIIVITGDIVDSRRTNVQIAINFAEKAIKIADVYYVTGNHESRIEERDYLLNELKKFGVTVLENESAKIQKGKDFINIAGMDDPDFFDEYIFEYTLPSILTNNDNFTVLLSHRPELLDVYAENSVDIVFSGHAHGGQFRVPFLGGVFAPHQGFFPEYDSGVFTKDSTIMVVSRGLGNSIFPFRLNNKPEIIVTTLENA